MHRLLDPTELVVGLDQFAVQLDYVEVLACGRVPLAGGDGTFEDLGVLGCGATTRLANLCVESIQVLSSHRDIMTQPEYRHGLRETVRREDVVTAHD